MSEQMLSHAIRESFERGGFTSRPETVNGVAVTLLYRSLFRWRWIATRLHVFTFVFEPTNELDVGSAQRLAYACLEHAKASKPGLPAGMQTGSAALPILIGSRVEDAVLQWARGSQAKDFAAVLFPVVVDASSGAVAYLTARKLWGVLYLGYLRGLVERHVVQVTRAHGGSTDH